MARHYVSPSEVLNRAIRAGLPEGIEESGNALWAKNGAMLTADPYGRFFRWVVTEADCATDHEFPLASLERPWLPSWHLGEPPSNCLEGCPSSSEGAMIDE